MPPRIPAMARPGVLTLRFRPQRASAVRRTAPSLIAAATVAPFSTTVTRPGLTVMRKNFLKWINDKSDGGGLKYRFKRRNRPAQYIFWSMRYRKDDYGGKGQKLKFEMVGDGAVRSSGAGGKAKYSHPNNPFPGNPHFKSQPVLSENVRQHIWHRVIRRGHTLKSVSADLTVDVRRVAAVVRLKELEKEQIKEAQRKGTPTHLTLPYARAVMSMLPKWGGNVKKSGPFEPINEIHMHRKTGLPLFWPVPESRQFTRADAALAFGPTMLPADKRVPHPELVEYERTRQQRDPGDRGQGRHARSNRRAFLRAMVKDEHQLRQKAEAMREAEAKATTSYMASRCEFRFKDMNVDDAGRDGRSLKGVGWRYGAPFYDRKRGNVKIPTSVE